MSTKKIEIITGAGQGIGCAIDIRLSRDGFRIGGLGFNQAKSAEIVRIFEESGGESLALSKQEQVLATVDEVVEAYGRLDVIASNVGLKPVTPIEEITLEIYYKVFDVNAGGMTFN